MADEQDELDEQVGSEEAGSASAPGPAAGAPDDDGLGTAGSSDAAGGLETAEVTVFLDEPVPPVEILAIEGEGALEDRAAEEPDEDQPLVAIVEAPSPPPPPPAFPAPHRVEIVPEHRGWRDRLRLRRAAAVLLAVLGSALVLGGAGIAYATYDYSSRYSGRILPGATIAGADIGGLTFQRAVRRVRIAIAPDLDREIRLVWKGRSWRVTPRELGARGNARVVVEQALAASKSASFFDKMQMRFLDDSLGFAADVAIRYPRQGARGFVEGVASSVDREPADAAIDYSTGWVEITPAKTGFTVDVDATHRALMATLERGGDTVRLDVKTRRPEVMEDDFDQILLVRIGENKLYLYEDGKITREWIVATGQPEYMTPTGVYEVTEKRYMPTWVNPAPTTWGASMPASIPPGPSNPLGLRAINWSAPAIRFHGTSATYSLGYNASHGCVRMSNTDVIELYDIVEVGTPIVSVVAGGLRPLYSSSSIGGEGG